MYCCRASQFFFWNGAAFFTARLLFCWRTQTGFSIGTVRRNRKETFPFLCSKPACFTTSTPWSKVRPNTVHCPFKRAGNKIMFKLVSALLQVNRSLKSDKRLYEIFKFVYRMLLRNSKNCYRTMPNNTNTVFTKLLRYPIDYV